MLMPAAGTTGVAAQSWETALALRGMALLQPDLPKYLLAPEVAVLLSCFYDERQRMLFAFLWNTGARITEALMVTPGRSAAGRSAFVRPPADAQAAQPWPGTSGKGRKGRTRGAAPRWRICPGAASLSCHLPARAAHPAVCGHAKNGMELAAAGDRQSRCGRHCFCRYACQPENAEAQLCNAPVPESRAAEGRTDLYGT